MDYMLFQNDEYITSIVAKEDFVKAYCQEKGYTYKRVPNVPEPEPEPTAEDITLDMLADHEERLCMLELTTTTV